MTPSSAFTAPLAAKGYEAVFKMRDWSVPESSPPASRLRISAEVLRFVSRSTKGAGVGGLLGSRNNWFEISAPVATIRTEISVAR
jgi:hypothetical protein